MRHFLCFLALLSLIGLPRTGLGLIFTEEDIEQDEGDTAADRALGQAFLSLIIEHVADVLVGLARQDLALPVPGVDGEILRKVENRHRCCQSLRRR